MAKNYLADYDLFAVSANAKETALNTEQTLDTSLLIAKSNIIQLQPRREDNKDELTGKEEPDTVYDLGHLAGGSIEFDKAQAQHFGLLLSYALGISTPGAWGAGYKHVITPIASMQLPFFTGGMRLGSTILKRRFASLHVGKVNVSFAKDAWAKISAELAGTGKHTDNITKETVVADYNAASLSLAANAVQGSTPALRLDNVHLVRVQVPSTLEWKDVVHSVVSDATPAAITITPPSPAASAITGLSKAAACVVTWAGHGLINGDKVTFAGITQADWSALNAEHVITYIGVDSFSIAVDTSAFAVAYDPATDPGTIRNTSDANYEIIYVPTEAAWCTFPARVSEPPLRVTDLVMKFGGKWNGTAFVGGHTMDAEIESIEYSLDNQNAIEFRPGGTGTYANYVLRQGRSQTLKLNRQARDYIMQQHIEDNDTFGVYMKATGAEWATGYNYYVELVFPKCAVLKADFSVNGKVIAEAGDIIVLEDDTYGSVRAEVANKVSAYAG
jgi:hypothetical protein